MSPEIGICLDEQHSLGLTSPQIARLRTRGHGMERLRPVGCLLQSYGAAGVFAYFGTAGPMLVKGQVGA
jgi:hypothetical protein